MHHQINKSLYKNIPFCLQLTSGSAPFSKKNETKGAALTDTAAISGLLSGLAIMLIQDPPCISMTMMAVTSESMKCVLW